MKCVHTLQKLTFVQVIGHPASSIFPKPVQSFVKCEHTNLFHTSGNTVQVEVSVAQMTGDRDLVTLRAGSPLAIHQIIKSMNDAVVLSDRYGCILAINSGTLIHSLSLLTFSC